MDGETNMDAYLTKREAIVILVSFLGAFVGAWWVNRQVTVSSQGWYWTPEFQAGEREIEEEEASGTAGKVIFYSDAEFQAALDAIPSATAPIGLAL